MTACPRFRALFSATLLLATLTACAEAQPLSVPATTPALTAGAMTAPQAPLGAARYVGFAKLNGAPFTDASVKIFLGASTTPLVTGKTGSDGGFSTNLGDKVAAGMPLQVVISKEHRTLAALTLARPAALPDASASSATKFHVTNNLEFDTADEATTAAYAVFKSEFLRLNHVHSLSDQTLWSAFIVLNVGVENAIGDALASPNAQLRADRQNQVSGSLDENGDGKLQPEVANFLGTQPDVQEPLKLIGSWTAEDIKAGLDKGGNLNEAPPAAPITLGDFTVPIGVTAPPVTTASAGQSTAATTTSSAGSNGGIAAGGSGGGSAGGSSGGGSAGTSGGGSVGSSGGAAAVQNPLINVMGNLLEPTFLAPPGAPAPLTCLTPGTLTAPTVLDYSLRTLFAGSSQPGGFVDGTGSSARFDGPRRFGIDSKGTVYVLDVSNQAIRRISNPGGVVDTFASAAVSGGAFSALAVTADGTVFLADNSAHTIRKIDRCTGAVTTIAGTGVAGFLDGPALAATFDGPYLLAVDRTGTKLYVGEKGKYDPNNTPYQFEYRIRVIDLVAAGNPVSTLIAGNFHLPATPSSTDVYSSFSDIVVDSHGTVFVLPGGGGEILQIAPTGIQTAFIGDFTSLIRTATDGTGTAATMGYSCGNLAIDDLDNLYFRDASAIRKVTAGAVVTTLSTTGNNISGWTVDKFGVLYGSFSNTVVKTAL
jgi:hypothetical protein